MRRSRAGSARQVESGLLLLQYRKIGRKESPVSREKGVSDGDRVRADQEVGDDTFARPSGFAITLPAQPGFVCNCGADRRCGHVDRLQCPIQLGPVAKHRGKFRIDDVDRGNHLPRISSRKSSVLPPPTEHCKDAFDGVLSRRSFVDKETHIGPLVKTHTQFPAALVERGFGPDTHYLLGRRSGGFPLRADRDRQVHGDGFLRRGPVHLEPDGAGARASCRCGVSPAHRFHPGGSRSLVRRRRRGPSRASRARLPVVQGSHASAMMCAPSLTRPLNALNRSHGDL